MWAIQEGIDSECVSSFLPEPIPSPIFFFVVVVVRISVRICTVSGMSYRPYDNFRFGNLCYFIFLIVEQGEIIRLSKTDVLSRVLFSGGESRLLGVCLTS